MLPSLTQVRQVKLNACSIYAPGMENRVPAAYHDTVVQNGIDISSRLQQIDIYESIFDNTISGSITVLENIGLIELIPIVGVEYLWLSFSVEDETGTEQRFERMFRIIKVRDVSYPRHDHRIYTLELSTHEFVTSVASRISRAYTGVTCEQAVVDILTRDLGVDPTRILDNESTTNAQSVTIPNYTPLQAINFFTLLAQTNANPPESNFVFYETLRGFHFTSIAKLIKDGKASNPKTFEANPGGVSGAEQTTDATVRNALFRIYNEQTFDTLMDIAGGTLRAKMIHFDFLARKLVYTADSRYTDTFKGREHLANNAVYPDNYDQGVSKSVRIFTFPSNYWSKDSKYIQSIDPMQEQRLFETIVLQNRQMKEITHLQTLVDMPGHPDIHAGAVIIINYPSTRQLNNTNVPITAPVLQQPTPLHSGFHLVTHVHHMLLPQGTGSFEYRMNLKACRDSVNSPLPAFTAGETYDY